MSIYQKFACWMNLYISYDGNWHVDTPNISAIKKRVNHDLIDDDRKKLEIARKYSQIIENDKNVYMSCLRYTSGNCWWNGRLSHPEQKKSLTSDEIKDIELINRGICMVEPLPFGVDLLHGFERHLKYGEDTWKMGNTYNFPFFLSKTPSWKVATFFSEQTNQIFQQYLFCRYNNSGSKHICIDCRNETNDEYEYLAYGENFNYIEKIYHLSLFPHPVFRIYHVGNILTPTDRII
jgi:hypothetical protein